jgi:hypothetical protein
MPQVHWLRVILDDGHTIGSTAITNKLQMATELLGERRWVMTGQQPVLLSWHSQHARLHLLDCLHHTSLLIPSI